MKKQVISVLIHHSGLRVPGSPHLLVLLRGGEDLGLSDEDVAEGPAAAALLVEAGDGAHGQGLDGQRLGVREAGFLRHHAAHVANVPG